MKRSMTEIVAGLVLAVSVACSMQVMAETEEINPIRVKTRQINAYGPYPIQIMGTNMTATAAQLNLAGAGTTATIAPTTANITTCNAGTIKANAVTASNTLTVSKQFVQTGDTLTVTQGAVLLTPTNNTIYVAGQYGVVTMSVAAATAEMTVRIINRIATNIVYDESNGLQLPAGYTAITNGQWDSITLTSSTTNWICTGWQDN